MSPQRAGEELPRSQGQSSLLPGPGFKELVPLIAVEKYAFIHLWHGIDSLSAVTTLYCTPTAE